MPQRRLVVRELIDRDINAAKNILAWGLNPINHAKHITLGVDPALLVVKI